VTIASDAAPPASSQLIGTTLRAVAAVTGMQLAFVSAIEAETYTWRHVHGTLEGIAAGMSLGLAETFCARMLDGAPPSTHDALTDPAYTSTPIRERLGIGSYVGVPLRRAGAVIGTLGGLDPSSVQLSSAELRVVAALGRVVSAEAAADPDIRLHRTAAGWEVEVGDGSVQREPEMSLAMSLADLIAGDGVPTVPPQRPQRPPEGLGELERLQVQIRQLEHALSARVVIEQAIGVLAQRFGVAPREAFDRLRRSARSRGQRVHDLAVDVVRSARDRATSLPTELS
jgi:hypothetical protein